MEHEVRQETVVNFAAAPPDLGRRHEDSTNSPWRYGDHTKLMQKRNRWTLVRFGYAQ